VAGRCGIAAEDIRELAHELAAAERAAVYGRLGTCAQEYGTLASWLIGVANVLTGHLDAPGGAMFPRRLPLPLPGIGKGIATGRHHSRVSAPEVFGELPITCLAEEIETPGKGQVRCTALVNPSDAARLGLRDGGMARIAGEHHAIEVQVELSDEMMPGVVSLPPRRHSLRRRARGR
jgi:anaerobic selenocysteine-containing dehydrogenase